jgi:diaminopimelate decarboxylase
MGDIMTDDRIQDVLKNAGTPLYLYDLDEAARRADEVRAMLGADIGLCFAMKSNPFIVKTMAEHADRIECCSIGEFRIAVRQHVPFEKIYFSGVMKTKEEIAEVMDLCRDHCTYTAESVSQFRDIAEAAEARNIRVRVFPRLTSGNQFGMDMEEVRNLLALAESSRSVQIIGIHYFSGTQKKARVIRKELDMLKTFFGELAATGKNDLELEYGPGFPIGYFENDSRGIAEDEVRQLAFLAKEIGAAHVTFEMGRFLAASCGSYLTSVRDVKKNGKQTYVILDGGIHQIQYDGQIRGMFVPEITVMGRESGSGSTASAQPADNAERSGQAEQTEAREAHDYVLCGSLCTVNDILCARYESSTRLLPGDVLIFHNAGAYSAFEGMALFLSHDLPAVVTWSRAEGFQTVRKSLPTWTLNTK